MRKLCLGFLLLLQWQCSLALDSEKPPPISEDARKKKVDLQLRGRKKEPPKPGNAGITLQSAKARSEDNVTKQIENLDALSREHWKQMQSKILEALHGRVDYNKDGKLALGEMVRFAQERHFNSANDGAKEILFTVDKNHDGKLSLKEVSDEWDLLLQQDYQALLNSSDINETDKALARTEIDKVKELETRKFEAADKDKDGLLNHTEITSMFFPETDPETMEVYIQDLIDQHDHDKNGKIGLHELAPGNDTHAAGQVDTNHDFHALDEDGDGHLDVEELKPWTDGTFSWHKMLSNVLSLADHDSDKHVTLDELQKSTEVHKLIQEWGLHEEF